MGVTAKCGALIAPSWDRGESAGLGGGGQTACLQPEGPAAAASWVLHMAGLCPLEPHRPRPSSPRPLMAPKTHSPGSQMDLGPCYLDSLCTLAPLPHPVGLPQFPHVPAPS